MLSTPAHLLGTPSCLICGVPLSHLQRARNDRFCGDRCRGKYATLPPHQVCVACGRPLFPRQFGDRLCGSLECRRQVEQQMRERERLRLEVLQNRAEGLRDRVGQGLRLEKPETYTPMVLPASRARITELPECRRHAFREFVNRLLGVAGAPDRRSALGRGRAAAGPRFAGRPGARGSGRIERGLCPVPGLLLRQRRQSRLLERGDHPPLHGETSRSTSPRRARGVSGPHSERYRRGILHLPPTRRLRPAAGDAFGHLQPILLQGPDGIPERPDRPGPPRPGVLRGHRRGSDPGRGILRRRRVSARPPPSTGRPGWGRGENRLREAGRIRVIVSDRPTTSLGPMESDRVCALVRCWSSVGVIPTRQLGRSSR